MTAAAKKEKLYGRPMNQARKEDLDAQTARHALYQGVSVTDMVILFRMDRRTLLTKIPFAQITPAGKRGKFDIYHIRDVAPYLVKPAGDMEQFLKRARPTDLPPILLKEFWNGQRAQLSFLKERGELWPTDKVYGAFAELVGLFRQVITMLPDDLQRRAGLDDNQTNIVNDVLDKGMEAMRTKTVEHFGNDFSVEPGITEYQPEYLKNAEPGEEDEDDDEDDTFYVPEHVEDEDPDDTFDTEDDVHHGL